MQLKYISTRGSKLTYWGRLKDVFLERFEDVCRMFLQNFKNKQQRTFKYFT